MEDTLCSICSKNQTQQCTDFTIANMYSEIIGSHPPEDLSICHLCKHNLTKLFKFRNLCITSNLRLMYGSENINKHEDSYLHPTRTNTIVFSQCVYCIRDPIVTQNDQQFHTPLSHARADTRSSERNKSTVEINEYGTNESSEQTNEYRHELDNNYDINAHALHTNEHVYATNNLSNEMTYGKGNINYLNMGVASNFQSYDTVHLESNVIQYFDSNRENYIDMNVQMEVGINELSNYGHTDEVRYQNEGNYIDRLDCAHHLQLNEPGIHIDSNNLHNIKPIDTNNAGSNEEIFTTTQINFETNENMQQKINEFPLTEPIKVTQLGINTVKSEIKEQLVANIIPASNEIEVNVEKNEIQQVDMEEDADSRMDEHLSETESHHLDYQSDDVDDPCENHEEEETIKKSKKNKIKKEDAQFQKITLTVKQQKENLKAMRKQSKYLEAKFKCYSCALGFSFKDSYRSHMVRHEESNGQYSCAICQLRFAQRAGLAMHRSVHSERHVCARCGRCTSGAGRRRHAAACGGLAARCGTCGHVTSDKDSLKRHIKDMHSGRTKSYTCNICSMSYKYSSSLRVHMIKHGNERFPCPQCPASFSNPYYLQQHKARHTRAPTTWHCAPCDVWFKSRKTYAAHYVKSKAHVTTSYPCETCSRICPTRASLLSHSLSHSSERHICELCSASFSCRKHLRAHHKTHEGRGATSVVCHRCGKTYKGKSHLIRHLKSVCELKEQNHVRQ